MTKSDFLKNIDDWSNHRELLWPALEATKHMKLPVLELGSGNGSTPFLRQYCKDEGLEFHSYDSNEQWAKDMDVTHVTNWNLIPWRKDWGVVLVDHAPGDHRKEALKLLLHAQIVVIHDSEILGHNASNYQVRSVFEKYKYMKDLVAPKPEAWATILSNFIDVSKFEL